MIAYLQEVQRLFSKFAAYNIQLLSRTKNTQADALAKPASTKDAGLLKIVAVKFLAKPRIEVEPQVTMPGSSQAYMDGSHNEILARWRTS